jgi:Cft2 family RNA processing exonuclease
MKGVGAVLAKSENSSAAFRYRSALFKSCISATPNTHTHKQMTEEMDLECGDAGANLDGAKKVNIFGEDIPVRARIYTINGFSAHADQAELLAWQKQNGAKRTFLVHGEEDAMSQFAAHLVDTRVEMPGPNQVVDL